ncbi:transporter [Lentzea sp. NBRC 105346]|uniref:RDD family protein n=1 Tax=Lentzea sp. NBRC 105346 TaxID=3032205 RepID=UPI0024A5B48C|nr:RDD family protein [Lentzea sp. NBRC 105346]GLZ28808.1 transporter [Lentzea sp. NBRC 105346]
MGDLVTGEAVVVSLRTARLASRALAFGLDVAIQAATLYVLYLILPTPQDAALLRAAALVAAISVLIGYPVLTETLTRGRTVGKLVFGLRVVRDDGGPIRFRHALVRGLAGFFVDFWALGLGGVVALLVSLASTQGKRVGDYLAGTVVIRVRVPKEKAPQILMPPELAAWAAGLDLTALPDDLALAARSYLARFANLSTEAQWTLGTALADDVAQRIAAPRHNLPPYAYLSAVLAERRERALRAQSVHHNGQ